MCAAIVASPALAAGPPGWLFFAVVVVGSAAIGALTMSSSQPTTRTRTQTRTRDRVCVECPSRPWSVRVHAQGTQIGGRTGSTLGAPPIIKNVPVMVIEGNGLAAATYALLTRRQGLNLTGAYEKCISFISSCPPAGFLGSKSFYGRSRDNNRFDVDSYGLTPNFIT